jgi:hypothetical protein
VRKWLGVWLLAAFIVSPLTACSNAIKTTGAAGIDDSIQALASGGVAVMDDVTSAVPINALSGTPSAMRFTRWQVRNLVAEANAHNGYLGSELDALVTPPQGVPPISAFIGAWLTRHQGPLAEYAQRFMGDQDYKKSQTIVFPSIVVLTFIADIARLSSTAQARPSTFDLGPWIASPASADGICTDVSNWVSNVVNNVTSAVQANGSGWLASIWNTVVTIAGTAFSIIVNGVLQSIVGFVTEIATVVATLTQVASMFKPWTVQLAADPAIIVLGPAPVDGAFDATLTAQDIPWPKTLLDCVSALSHVNLTDASYKNAQITWSQPMGIPGLASNLSQDGMLRDDKTAHYTYSTIAANSPQDCPVLVNTGTLGITVTVARTDVSKAIDSLLQLISNKLPAKLQSFLTPYEQPAIAAAKTAIGNFKSPHSSATTRVMEYIPDPLCTHDPPSSTTGSTSNQPQAQAAKLPFAPCDQIVTNGDVGAAFPGAVLLDPYMRPETSKFLRNIVLGIVGIAHKVNVSTRGVENIPNVAQQTACSIGPPYTAPPAPNPDNPPVEAFFITLPPDGTPVDTAKSAPGCLAQLGPELAYFKAECWNIGSQDHAGGPVNGTLLFVFTEDAKYVVESLGGSGSGVTLMRSVLQHHEGAAPP